MEFHSPTNVLTCGSLCLPLPTDILSVNLQYIVVGVERLHNCRAACLLTKNSLTAFTVETHTNTFVHIHMHLLSQQKAMWSLSSEAEKRQFVSASLHLPLPFLPFSLFFLSISTPQFSLALLYYFLFFITSRFSHTLILSLSHWVLQTSVYIITISSPLTSWDLSLFFCLYGIKRKWHKKHFNCLQNTFNICSKQIDCQVWFLLCSSEFPVDYKTLDFGKYSLKHWTCWHTAMHFKVRNTFSSGDFRIITASYHCNTYNNKW